MGYIDYLLWGTMCNMFSSGDTKVNQLNHLHVNEQICTECVLCARHYNRRWVRHGLSLLTYHWEIEVHCSSGCYFGDREVQAKCQGSILVLIRKLLLYLLPHLSLRKLDARGAPKISVALEKFKIMCLMKEYIFNTYELCMKGNWYSKVRCV